MKKIRPNFLLRHFPIIVTLLVVVIAIFSHPSINSYVFLPYRQMLWNEFVSNLSDSTPPTLANLWQFREFYSRGQITLNNYDSEKTQETGLNLAKLPSTFEPYLAFNSNKIKSIEGFIDPQSVEAVLHSPEFDHYETVTSSSSFKLAIDRTNNQAILITVYNPVDAALANGYLHFDMRDETFKQMAANKLWLVVTKIDLS